MSQLKDYQINFINEAMRVGALEFGTFTLKSGRQSPYFFNASKLLFDADINIIIEGFAHKFLEFGSDINQLFGPAYKGTIFGSMLGMHLKKTNPSLSLCFNRKEVKDHGEGGMFIGQSPSGSVVVVDDVLSAGTAAKESIDLILENDATPSGILVGLNRQEKGTSDQSASFELEQTYNLKVLSVICLDDLINFLKQSDQAEFIGSMESYRDKWGA